MFASHYGHEIYGGNMEEMLILSVLHKSNRIQKMSHGTQKGSVAGHTTFYTIKMCMKSFPYMSDIYPAVKKCHIVHNKRNNK